MPKMPLYNKRSHDKLIVPFNELFADAEAAMAYYHEVMASLKAAMYDRLLQLAVGSSSLRRLLLKSGFRLKYPFKSIDWGRTTIIAQLFRLESRIVYLSYYLDEKERNFIQGVLYCKRKVGTSRRKPPTMLLTIYENIVSLNVRFRTRVCEECDWSIGTYFRKMRFLNGNFAVSKGVQSPLSNAEKYMVLRILDEELSNILALSKEEGI